jgi:NitT/TauT family transport system substrate-binding protein
MRNRFWRVCPLRLYLALAVSAALCFLPRAASAEKVTLLLDWVPYGKHAWQYAALDLGLFKKAGLEVKIIRGFGSGDTLKKVATKNAEFGFADYGSLVLARARGAKVKGTAVLQAKAPYSNHVLSGSGIKTVKDFEGKRLAVSPGSSQTVLWPAFAKLAGFNAGKIVEVPMPPAAQSASLMSNKIDITAQYSSQRVILSPMAKKLGQKIVTFLWADYGIDIYANGNITHDDLIKNQPDLVRRFTTANMKGVAYSVEHPEDAIKRLRKYHPAIGQKIGVDMLQWHNAELMVEEAKKHGIGWISKEKMTRTRDLVLNANNLPISFPVEDLYTMKFRPALFPKWKRPAGM